MTKLTLLGATATLTMVLTTPAISQEATQEPGMIGFNYPNSNYLRGGYGVRLPSRHDHGYYYGGDGPRVYYRPDPAGIAAGIVAGTAGAVAGAPYYDSYGYDQGPY
jgi:hypothetical protein